MDTDYSPRSVEERLDDIEEILTMIHRAAKVKPRGVQKDTLVSAQHPPNEWPDKLSYECFQAKTNNRMYWRRRIGNRKQITTHLAEVTQQQPMHQQQQQRRPYGM